MLRRVRPLLSLLLLLAACRAPSAPGAQCVRNSDCSSPFVCLASACRQECVAASDCPRGLACNGGVCDLPPDASSGSDASAADSGSSGPQPVAEQLSLGYVHACAVRSGGAVYCWGLNECGQAGTAMDVGDCTRLTNGRAHYAPTRVEGLTEPAAEVGAGENFSCARTRGGAVYCWGSNQDGQLGTGSAPAFSSSAVLVAGVSNAVDLAVGSRHACVVRSDGSVRCWGQNRFGQAGVAGLANTPSTVGAFDDAVAVSAGTSTTCVLRRSGAPACWGADDVGQLGLGSTADTRPVSSVDALAASLPSALSLGHGSTCGLFAGAVRCWGAAGSGQLGDGTMSNRTSPALGSMVPGLTDVRQVSVSRFSTDTQSGGAAVCALHATGSVECWGDDTYYKLGSGNGINMNRAMPGVLSGGLSNVAELSMGFLGGCVRLTTGRVACWGLSGGVLLGGTPMGPQPTPALVENLPD